MSDRGGKIPACITDWLAQGAGVRSICSVAHTGDKKVTCDRRKGNENNKRGCEKVGRNPGSQR